jgi:hypothetical protein
MLARCSKLSIPDGLLVNSPLFPRRRDEMKATKFSRREFLRASALTAVGAALAACAVPAVPSESPGTGAAQPPTPEHSALTLWGWWDQRMAIYESAATQFTKANPDVEIKG